MNTDLTPCWSDSFLYSFCSRNESERSEAICHVNSSKHSYRSYFLSGNYLTELLYYHQFQLTDDAYES